jgi:hypothetical protein
MGFAALNPSCATDLTFIDLYQRDQAFFTMYGAAACAISSASASKVPTPTSKTDPKDRSTKELGTQPDRETSLERRLNLKDNSVRLATTVFVSINRLDCAPWYQRRRQSGVLETRCIYRDDYLALRGQQAKCTRKRHSHQYRCAGIVSGGEPVLVSHVTRNKDKSQSTADAKHHAGGQVENRVMDRKPWLGRLEHLYHFRSAALRGRKFSISAERPERYRVG